MKEQTGIKEFIVDAEKYLKDEQNYERDVCLIVVNFEDKTVEYCRIPRRYKNNYRIPAEYFWRDSDFDGVIKLLKELGEI